MASRKKESLHLLLCFVAAVASCLEKRESENCWGGNERASESSRGKKSFTIYRFFLFHLKNNKQEQNSWKKCKESIKRFRGCDLNFN